MSSNSSGKISPTLSSRLCRSDVRKGSAFPKAPLTLRATPAMEHKSSDSEGAAPFLLRFPGRRSLPAHHCGRAAKTQPNSSLIFFQRSIQYAIFTVLCAAFFSSCTKPIRTAEPAPNFFKVDAKTAGTISGKINFSGKKSSHKIVKMDADPQCEKLHPNPLSEESIAANKAGMLANVFVYIKSGLENKNFKPPVDPVVIDQNGCWFNPRVLGIQVGQTLQVKNSDPVTHNIHPLPTINREWNQSQAPDTEPFTRKFTQPEVMIKVKCNIHAWMHAWVGAVAHPYFAVTGADGTFQFKRIPPGNYTIEIWHEELGKQSQQVTLSPASESELTFNFK
jgi:plastocyanin